MNIEFQELTFKNILSFGAKETKLEFKRGLNLIHGKNGSGKSSILDVLSYCLFGKAYRKIKIKELINRKNKKGLETTCTFTVNHTDIYKISRSMTGSGSEKLKITKNTTESDLLSSKSLNQDDLNKLLGINHSLFRQIISLAVNYNKPFLTLEAKDKRELVEQIFNVQIFGDMLKLGKSKNSGNSAKNDINQNSLTLMKENISTQMENLRKLKQTNQEIEANFEEEIKETKDKLKKFEDDIDISKQEIQKIEEYLKNMKDKKLDEMLTKLEISSDKLFTRITELKVSLEINNKSIIFFNNNINVPCPSCKNIITEEHKQIEIKRLENENEKLTIELEAKQEAWNDLSGKINKINDVKKTIDNKSTELKNKQFALGVQEREATSLRTLLADNIKPKLIINLDDETKDLESKKDEYTQLFKSSKSLKKLIENYAKVFMVLSDSGIKSYFFKKMIPLLNTKINEYLQLFEIPIVLMFDEYMNETITSYTKRDDISYYANSEGEKKRIDISILLSFINITKLISNWNCNLLVIDELLDGAIDEDGLDKLVSCLKTMVTDNNMDVYIISHRLFKENKQKFNKVIFVEKKHGFSEISYS
jgi:DNA repair exonuclease SbcCD ATPase subunit